MEREEKAKIKVCKRKGLKGEKSSKEEERKGGRERGGKFRQVKNSTFL